MHSCLDTHYKYVVVYLQGGLEAIMSGKYMAS